MFQQLTRSIIALSIALLLLMGCGPSTNPTPSTSQEVGKAQTEASFTTQVLAKAPSPTTKALPPKVIPSPSPLPSSPPPISPSQTIVWKHLSSAKGDLKVAGPKEQTASLVFDLDKDGSNDLLLGGRRLPPALTWYRRTKTGWTPYIVEKETLSIEAGGAFYDIDGDGDLDVVMGEDYSGNKVYWWENPYPNYDPQTPWKRHSIKTSGANMHHDLLFGDFNGDGHAELVFWNQKARQLFLASIPPDPRNAPSWPLTVIFTAPTEKYEGLAQADIDGDGKVDLLAAGLWFKHVEGTKYISNTIASQISFTRVAAGQLIEGGAPEVLFAPGDLVGRLLLYTWTNNKWASRDLLGQNVDHGHSLEVADLNNDGHLDIFCAEMRLSGSNPASKMWILLGDGQGNFTKTAVAEGYDNHESRLADLDGDGRIDILGKPYNYQTPRLDIWLNTNSPVATPAKSVATPAKPVATPAKPVATPVQPITHSVPLSTTILSLDSWKRIVLDEKKPWGAVFITAADLNGDKHQDVISGGWWYQNPGNAEGRWVRHFIGDPLYNLAAVSDFDRDGALDILGTKGKGADVNANFVWAKNDGKGRFTILDNIEPAKGDFLQGVAISQSSSGTDIALSWHVSGKGVQLLTAPFNPTQGQWRWSLLHPFAQDEALSIGDLNRDGKKDLLLGTTWLQNNGIGISWTLRTLFATKDAPDRNRLADLNGDGRLDAVVGYEAVSKPGKLAWYEQGEVATAPWVEHLIATVVGPMSLDVADLDHDGDLDVVVGEHNLSTPAKAGLFLFENADGKGETWIKHTVFVGDEHHDGAQLVDIDSDGDLDILSLGWGHGKVLLYENLAIK